MVTHAVADSSVRAPEPQRPAMMLIGGFGAASCLFSVAAELSRVRTYTLQPVEAGHVECRYPPSESMWYAIAGALSLLAAQVAGFVCGSFSWCPARPHSSALQSSRIIVAVVLTAQLVLAAGAAAALLSAAIENASLPAEPLGANTGNPKCIVLDDGIFLTAAVLCLFATILIETYYVLSMRAKGEEWMEAYSAGPLEGIEMLGQETSVLRVRGATPKAEADDADDDDVDVDVLGGSSFMPSFGKKEGNFGRAHDY